MTKISYASLKLKINTDVKKISFNDSDIEVLQYLPIEEKISLISIVLQNAYEDNIYNPIKLEMLFHLYLVFEYTNLTFTDKQKENLFKLYDIIKSSKLLDKILEAIPEEEYQMLFDYLEDIVKNKTKLNRSAVGLVQSFISDLPKQANAAMDIVNHFDKEKYQNVIDFAKAANGGRDIK